VTAVAPSNKHRSVFFNYSSKEFYKICPRHVISFFCNISGKKI
jgi:hypothetical protein